MEAIVLAGGFGTRLSKVVSDVPKPMAPVANRPFLEILFDFLISKGFNRAVLSLGYLSETIIGHFGNNYKGLALFYVVEDQPLGTGGAIRFALQSCVEDHAYIFNGDTFLNLEVDQLESFWQNTKQPIIVLREVPDTSRYGRVELDGLKISEFLEKGINGVGLINAGCYVFPRNLLDEFQLNQHFSLESEFFVPQVGQKKFMGFVSSGLFIDIGVPEDYYEAQTLLKDLIF